LGWPPCDVQSLETCESGRWEDRFECQEATAEAVLQMPTNADQGADWFIHEVNRAWAGLFLQDEWLEQPETVELVKSLSTTAPLLFFFDADEYGWGYRLSAGGEERTAKAFEVQTPEPSEWTVSMSEDEAKMFR